MKLSFTDIIDTQKDKTAIVIGLGPSLNKTLAAIKKLPKDKYVLISCNNIDKFTGLTVDYWVLTNSELNIKNMYTRMNTMNATVVYADSIDLTDRATVDKVLAVNYLPYDQRHFGSKKCGAGKCCSHIIPGRLTIQEEFKQYTKYNKLDTSCDTVAIPMLYLSVMLGCKNIYVTGVDLNYKGGYVNGNAVTYNNKISDSLFNCQPRTLNTMKVIDASAKNIGTNIYAVDSGSPIAQVFSHKTLP